MTQNASQVINIMNGWIEENAQEIAKGTNIESPQELLEYERKLMLLLIKLGALIIAWVIKSLVEDRDFQKTAAQIITLKKSKRYRFQSYLKTSFKTLFGNTVKVKTRYHSLKQTKGRKRGWGKRGKKGSGFFPALELLGIMDNITPALVCEVAREVTDGPSMDAARQRFERKGVHLDIKTIQNRSGGFAAKSIEVRKEWLESGGRCDTSLIPKGETFKGMRIAMGTDGGTVRTRENKRGRRPKGKKRNGFNTPWREAKLMTIRSLDDRGNVTRELDPIYDGTTGNADHLFEIFEAHLRARDISSALEIDCIGDGAAWIWNRMRGMLEGLGVDPSKIRYVVDFYHAFEHLVKVANERRGWNKRTRKRWLKKMRSLLKQGKIEEIIEELKKLARGRNAKAVKIEIGYFENHKERMRYDELKKEGFPIGSGATESAIKQVVNQRLKGASMYWKKFNVEGYLHLRCYLKAGRWDIMERAVIGYQKDGG